MAGECLFVYGTLRRQGRGAWRILEAAVEYLGEASLQALLFEVAGYPGLVESDDPRHRVTGELYRLRDAALLLALDEYEECTPAFPQPHEYQRRQLSVILADGREVSA